ncbi:hypothetical protein B5E56_06275 [Flavonifractor sp. An112]|uniref:ParB N-terminal domain-containing protein n=1 Tax=Flavonifractor sp. An112 TaxID=1965544 RepID=UPI000B39A6BA|nr:ParB N-terminal domain-containing protein [Flavonifractor sp. An112]OUQ60756.1 hypothetical protein B5E56_06275 [Flavonifractor sp. An112]
MPRNRVQNALRQRKQDEASANQATGQTQEKAYDCFFHHDDLPSPMENGTLCTLPLKQLDGFPGHEEHFPLYTGQRLDDMVDSIRRLGVQTPILVWKTSNGRYIIISGHNRVNASVLAGRTTIPAVVRTDLTLETAEDLFFEMNFRQRSLADMLFSQRVLCVAAHYNMMKRQGRRTDLLTAAETSPDTQEKSDTGDPATSPDTQEKSHTDEKIAQEYELTRDKVSKYCRYATLYRPLLLLMDTGKQLGQLAAYEVSFVEDHDLQECIYQHISAGKSALSTAKGKKLRALFEAGNLDAAQIKAILTEETTTAKRPGRRISVTLSADFESYFPKKATAKEIEETIQKALELYFKTTKSSL